jgi:ribosomal protein S18 acetylase RimI-like enzyme
LLLGTWPVLALGDAAAMLCRKLGGDAMETALCGVVGAVTFEPSPLTEGLESCERMLRSVRRLRLPASARVLARSQEETVGFMHDLLPIYGIQFALESNDTDGMQLLWARDRETGRSVVEALVEPTVVDCLEPSLVRDVELAHALTEVMPYHLAIYEKKTPIEVDAGRDIRPLDDGYFDAVRSTYSHPEYKTDDEIHELLRSGRMWGAFVEGELVGYIGEHPVGSMGMLEVFPDWRRQGWALALEATLINETLRRGETPWCEVYPDNKASIRLQRKLGLKVTPANEQCYLSAPRRPVPHGAGPEDVG